MTKYFKQIIYDIKITKILLNKFDSSQINIERKLIK